jgi:hypothetical protein
MIDVREQEQYRSGHLPRAPNLPRGVLELKKDNGTMTRKTCIRAAMAIPLVPTPTPPA